MQLIDIEYSSPPEATRMSQEHFGRTSPAAAAPPKPRRLYRLPDADDYADNGSDSHAPALHVSKVRLGFPSCFSYNTYQDPTFLMIRRNVTSTQLLVIS